MQLNDLLLINYDSRYQEVWFTLSADFPEVSALNGQLLTVTEGEEIKAQFGGYQLLGIERQNAFLRAHFMKTLEPNTQQSLSALETNQDLIMSTTQDHTDQIDLIAGAVEELIAITLGD